MKRPRHQGLTKNNVSRIVTLVLDAINDDDTDQDAGEIETSTVEETEDESVTQEVQNSIAHYTDNSAHTQYPTYSTWLTEWTSHLENSPGSIMVTPEATSITTPLYRKEWKDSCANTQTDL